MNKSVIFLLWQNSCFLLYSDYFHQQPLLVALQFPRSAVLPTCWVEKSVKTAKAAPQSLLLISLGAEVLETTMETELAASKTQWEHLSVAEMSGMGFARLS